MNIYEKIWEADENRLTISKRKKDGTFDNPNADILIDEQVEAASRRGTDLATRPLFHLVNQNKFTALPTFQRFISLLDNYIVNYRVEETTTPTEKLEINAFLDAILPTKPIKVARDYIETLGFRFSDADFKAQLMEMWFTIYTNHYQGKSTRYCTGFEHVFVGEGQYDARNNAGNNKGEISGYHNWVKFFFDEKSQRVNFLGHYYDLKYNQGPENPYVVTLRMIWDYKDLRGNPIAQLYKSKGGFFIGSSPECEIAMGTVAFFENKKGMMSSNDEKPFTLKGYPFSLVLYRNIDERGSRGKYIRSFYPKYLGGANSPGGDQVIIIPVETNTSENDGAVVITSALINPKGDDEGREYVIIKNTTTQPISLSGWTLKDRMGRPERIKGDLDAGQSKKIILRYAHDGAMVLGNHGGTISVVDNLDQVVSLVEYGNVEQGDLVNFV